tara:strand:+ start:9 stop:605 length:597 start_codon:yes stop_codon:yes gene_type:complete
MKGNIVGYILIILIVIICVKMYLDSDAHHLVCSISTVDGNKYCVRERKKLKEAVNLLATVTEKMKRLVKYMGEKYPDRENVKRLVKRFKPSKVSETLPTSEFTAYSENKGEKLAFCLNKNEHSNNNLIDENTLTFVAIHELTHIACKSTGHNDEFWYNFKFLLENAVKIDIYSPVDYKKNNVNYCGMDITDNPFYDLK